MISIIDSFRLVLKQMFEKKKRVLLTISGIIIGIFTFTFFIFVSQGLENAITEQFTTFGVNVLAVQPVGSGFGPPSDQAGLTDTDVHKIKQVVSDYKYVSPAIFYQGQYEYGREKAVMLSLAYPDEYWGMVKEDIGTEIEFGRDIRAGDKGSIVLGSKAAKSFGEDKPLKVGSSLKIKDRSFRVIGIMKEKGDLMIDNILIMSFDDIKDLSEQETYSIIRISFYEHADISAMEKAIDRKLNQRNKEKVINFTTTAQILEQFNQILGELTMIISFISSVALIVGWINVMNTMYSNVIERINNISVMKAIGATNGSVRNIFLIESGMLGIVGALLGFLMADLLAKGLSYLITNFGGFNVPVYFDFNFFMIVVLVTAMFAIIFGTYPAMKAASVDPADNLRDE